MSNEITLDLHYVHQSFQRSLKEEDDVVVEAYIDGYNELVKFLNLIGSVFSFVSSDVKNKIKVMEKHKDGDDAIYYESFKKMMKYEKETNLHEKSGFVSGSRTMLRLHRGLDFIRLFLKKLGDSDDTVNTCTECQSAYNATLAEFHPWYIRSAATFAMHALPNRPELLKKIFGSEDSLTAALAVLPQTLASCDEVYNRVQQLYTDFDFHGLPTGIHTPEDWSDWVSMGHINIRLNIAHECKPRTNWLAAIDLCITSYEVKIDTISSKLYYDEDLTDFLLSATGGKVAVHKAYLGAHSDVFKAMLKREWKETVEGQITMEGVTVQTLQHLKDYMYLGTLPNDGLQSLLLLARCYLIEDLERHCIRKLAETVQPEDLFPLLEFACANNIPELAYEMLQITQDSAVNKARKLKKAAEKQRLNTNICN